MADNVYLLETRLSPEQQTALETVRELARAHALTIFLVGGAVRDLISGTAVRDLDVAVQGDARALRAELEEKGVEIAGESDLFQTFYVRFPSGVRMEVGSTLSVTYPKLGKPEVQPATILEDLRRRDFTANAMALSLNEGSYGLLMDPLNGVADIENRELRLVSNYGFIEDPVRMIRAARLMARLGWTLEEKTQGRYETGREEQYLEAMDEFRRGYETEELFHEDDPLRILRRLEEEGWLKQLAPALSVATANAAELDRLREVQAQLQMQGLIVDSAALNFPLIAARLSPADVAAVKKSFPRQGFVREVESIDAAGKEFAGRLTAKSAALPSQSYQLLRGTPAEVVLWTAFYSKSPAVQAKFKSFSGEWPQARQRIPYPLLQEMRITPELPGYDALIEQIFFQLMDGQLTTTEQMKEFLEPFSPPAPPPVNLRRPRAPKKEAKSRSRKKDAAAAADPEDAEEPQSSVEADDRPELTPPPQELAPEPEAPPPMENAAPVAEEKVAAKPVKGKKTSAAPASDATGPEVSKETEAVEPSAEPRPAPPKKGSKSSQAPAAVAETGKGAASSPPTTKSTPSDRTAAKKPGASPAPVPAKSKGSPRDKAPLSAGKPGSTGKTAAKKQPAKKAAPQVTVPGRAATGRAAPPKAAAPASTRKAQAPPPRRLPPTKASRPSPTAKKAVRTAAPQKKESTPPGRTAKSAPVKSAGAKLAKKQLPKKRR